ncbi:hypothetical protein C2S51_020772 [Perilla frutescens var. frutescens]|nr:hypothetical protein C2S51_020772 [Perilla frutescens var. frutescens]
MITTLLMLLVIALPILILIISFLNKKRNPKTLVPPGPPPLPLIGNLHQFLTTTKSRHVFLSQLSKKYGPLIHMKLGPIPLLVITSSKLAKEVLKTQDLAFCSRPNFIGPQKFAYDASDIALAPYGDHWREVRKIMSVHLLSLRKIQTFAHIREDEIARLIGKISELASSQQAVNVNVSELAMAHVSTLVCRIAFGKGFGISRMGKFDELLHESQALMTAFYVSDYFPWFSWVDKLTGLMDRLDRTFQNLDSFYRELIVEHLDRDRGRRLMEGKGDILDVLIQIKEENSSSIDFNLDHVKALLKNVFLGGTDTSAALIVWIMTALIKAPEAMTKVQAEIRNFIGKNGKVNEEDLVKLPYLKAVVNETLRLYPPIPMLVPRETIKRCNLDGYEIEPKTVVYVNAWAIARDPDNWENPDEFMPERFLEDNVDIKGQDFRVIPFGSGRRVCPGLFMGLATVELTVANLLYSFDWKMPRGINAQDIDTDTLPGITMHKKNPLFLVPKKYGV